MEWFKKKWYIVVLAFGFLGVIITTAIVFINSSRELTPSQNIAVAYIRAHEKDDDQVRLALLIPEERQEHKEYLSGGMEYPERKIETYNLSEWKVNDKTFVYRMQYMMDGELTTKWTMTKKIGDGWGIGDLRYKPTSLEPLIQGKQEKIIREMKE